jgi:hypothetical protein
MTGACHDTSLLASFYEPEGPRLFQFSKIVLLRLMQP